MKIPEKPKPWARLLEATLSNKDDDRFATVLRLVRSPSVDGKYLHWADLKYREPPHGLSREEWWLGLKYRRNAPAQHLPLCDPKGIPFQFGMVERIVELVHHADRDAAGRIEVPDPITNPHTRDRYLMSSLIEEAVRSSQLEGAATTRREAANMIRSGRAPRDRDERMILNNFMTMKHIRGLIDKDLDEEMLFDIHRRITEGTLEHEDESGRYRRSDETINVFDARDGSLLYAPPDADRVPERMAVLIDFANNIVPAFFVHPMLRAIILHFWLAYEHPFTDGNGRTARSLFYWLMLKQGYWLSEYISISSILRNAPARYAMSFLHTETDENDLNYFLIDQLTVFRKAVAELHAYVMRKSEELRKIERGSKMLSALNHRQRALLIHGLRRPGQEYTIESHRRSHDIVYQTARRDLQDLEQRGLLVSRKVGRAFHYDTVTNLSELLEVN